MGQRNSIHDFIIQVLNCKSALVTSVIVFVTVVWILQVTRFAILADLTHLGQKNNNTQSRTTMGNLLHLTSQVAHCFEYFPMLHGIILFFLWKYKDKPERDSNDATSNQSDNLSCKSKLCKIILFLLFLVIHLGISILPPALLISWKEDNIAFYNESPVKGNVYAALAFIDHLYAFLVRSAMACVTILVIHAWKNAQESVNMILKKQPMEFKLQKLIDTYHSTGKTVNAIQNIFQGWFVIKWMVYFINIAGHSILVVEILLVDDKRGGEYEKHKLAFLFTQLFYNFFAFFFLFVCGSLMNRYHTNYRKYQESQKRKILSTSCDKYMLLMQSSNTLISEVPEYQFLPTIFSIDFPLNSPGYTLTILLALFVFIANFVTQYR